MDITDLKKEIARRRALQPPDTYDEIGEDIGVSKALIWKIERGHEPISPVIRLRLGLPAAAAVVPVNGSAIPDGTQAHHALQCACGRWFIPNHPLRKRCFICGPYRGKRK